ncbi:MAG: AAA family ATPase, partial [Anaerolineales bacterium]|nr:AAA family ATPase [Anaerolineales bacterium]
PHVIKAYDLDETGRQMTIVFEDFGAVSLKQWQVSFPEGLPIELFLKMALKITKALGQLHGRQVIHKDINPDNIVIHPKTMALKLIDLGLSTQLSRENPSLESPNTLEGTLRYISPEQTGRMNRILDYRTDFYSLGVTFYELLSGRVPFVSDDPIELVHSHIANKAPPLNTCPPAIARIIAKLMAKNAEDRYQSARGIQADLSRCLDEWQAAGRINPFTLGADYNYEQFQIPQKLYGREEEIGRLINAFGHIDQTQATLVLVKGYSGIGKTAVVKSLYRPITERRGYFVSGKFDQFQRDTPYSALVSALTNLIIQRLGEPESTLHNWRDKILEAVGDKGQIVVDVIPALALIIGQQPAVQSLSGNENQTRFKQVFQSFIRACCSRNHPLVIFLDDLQWADLATLNLLQTLLDESQTTHLLFIGTYRDNEVDETHPLTLTIAQLQKKDVAVQTITLNPLALTQVTELIADTLHQPKANVTEMAEL